MEILVAEFLNQISWRHLNKFAFLQMCQLYQVLELYFVNI